MLGIMAMRAYAFTGRNKRIAILLVICYTLLVGVDIWTFTIHILLPPQELYTLLGGTGCFPNYGDKHLAFRYGVSPRILRYLTPLTCLQICMVSLTVRTARRVANNLLSSQPSSWISSR